MAESKMPARIWAHSSGGKCIVSFATPSLDYSVGYIRADLVEPLVEALRECVELFGDIRSDFSDPRSVCDKGRDIAEAAILRARQAADTEGRE